MARLLLASIGAQLPPRSTTLVLVSARAGTSGFKRLLLFCTLCGGARADECFRQAGAPDIGDAAVECGCCGCASLEAGAALGSRGRACRQGSGA